MQSLLLRGSSPMALPLSQPSGVAALAPGGASCRAALASERAQVPSLGSLPLSTWLSDFIRSLYVPSPPRELLPTYPGAPTLPW